MKKHLRFLQFIQTINGIPPDRPSRLPTKTSRQQLVESAGWTQSQLYLIQKTLLPKDESKNIDFSISSRKNSSENFQSYSHSTGPLGSAKSN